MIALIAPLLFSAALAQEPEVPPVAGGPVSAATAPADDAEALVARLREQIRAEVRAELEAQRAAEALPAQKPAPAGLADRVKAEALGVDEVVRFGGHAVRVRPDEVVESAVGFGTPVIVAGRVTGDATSFGADVRVLPGGVVEGDAVSFGGSVLVEDGGAVNGSRVSMGREHLDPAPRVASAGGWFAGLLRRLVVFLSFAGAGVVVVGLFPRRVGRVAERIAEGPATALAIGTLTATALVVGALVFALTIIGLPVTFLLVALLGLAWLMGFVGICQALGDRLPFEQKVHGRWLAFLAGTLLVAFVGSLPFVGVAGLVIASALGIGASVATRLGAV